jgi:hypothetical protein
MVATHSVDISTVDAGRFPLGYFWDGSRTIICLRFVIFTTTILWLLIGGVCLCSMSTSCTS